jgi:hypothetical protein
MTLPLDDAVATELPRERNRPATTGSRQPQKACVCVAGEASKLDLGVTFNFDLGFID